LSRWKIRRRYLKSWMAVDPVSSIPWDLLHWAPCVQPLVRLPVAPSSWRWPSGRAGSPSLALQYVSHILGCAWGAISSHEGFGSDGLPAGNYTRKPPGPSKYFSAFFCLLPALTDRDRDFSSGTPQSHLESVSTPFGMLVRRSSRPRSAQGKRGPRRSHEMSAASHGGSSGTTCPPP